MSLLPSRLSAVGCAIALAAASMLAPPPVAAQASQRGAIDEQALRQDMQRAIDRRRSELLPEYQRRVREDGKASADAWLRATAERLGREDGQQVRRDHDRGKYDAASRGTAGASATGDRRAAGGKAAGKGKDPACARMVTRQRNVPSVSGGPMQMIMVTECVPASR